MKRIHGLLVAAAIAVGCDGPEAGEVVLHLVTPNGDDGAVQFVLTAPPGVEIPAVDAACERCEAFVETVTPEEVRGVVTGVLTSGPFLRVTLSDVDRFGDLMFVFVEAASRTYDLRASTAGYDISVSR